MLTQSHTALSVHQGPPSLPGLVTPVPSHAVCVLVPLECFLKTFPPPHNSLYLHSSRLISQVPYFALDFIVLGCLLKPLANAGKHGCHSFLLRRGKGWGRRCLPLYLQPLEIHSARPRGAVLTYFGELQVHWVQ